jgi:polar amino acid transport system substrate-binding protein
MRLKAALVGIVLGVLGTQTAAAQNVRIVTFDSPPFTETKDGKVGGYGVDFVAEVARAAGLNAEVESLPLPRVIEALDKGNAIAVMLTRTPAREDKYTWLAPLYEDSFAFLTLKGQPVVASLGEARNLPTIATVRDGAPEAYLKRENLTNVDSATSEQLNVKKLLAGRASTWFTNVAQARFAARNEGVSDDQLVAGPAIIKAPFWIAGSKNLSPELVQNFAKAYEDLKKAGRYDAFVKQIQ